MKTVYILRSYHGQDQNFGTLVVPKYDFIELSATAYSLLTADQLTKIETAKSLRRLSVAESQVEEDDTNNVLVKTQIDALDQSTGGRSAYGGGYKSRPLMHVPCPIGTTAIDSKFHGTATATMAVDDVVKFNGHPSTKVSITAGGNSPSLEVGVSTATVPMDEVCQQALSRTIMCAVKVANGNTVSDATLYLGSQDYAAFYTFGMGVGPTTDDGWLILSKGTPGYSSNSGSPSLAGNCQSKLRVTMTGNLTAGDINIGGVYILPQSVPTVLLSFDDGYKEHVWLMQEAKKRGIPISFSISYSDITSGNPAFMTTDELKLIGNDPSGNYECVNHARANEHYGTLGLVQYVADCVNCRQFLVDLGLSYRSASCHVYVQGQQDQTLINALKANDFLSARLVGSSGERILNEQIVLIGKSSSALFQLPATVNLGNGTNFAQAKTYLLSAAPAGGAMIMGHRLQATAASEITWVKGYHPLYGILDLLDWLAYKRDVDGWRIMLWSKWVEDAANQGWRDKALLS